MSKVSEEFQGKLLAEIGAMVKVGQTIETKLQLIVWRLDEVVETLKALEPAHGGLPYPPGFIPRAKE